MHAATVCHVMSYGSPTSGSFIPCLESLAHAVRQRGSRFAVLAAEVPNATWPRRLSDAGADVRLVRSSAEMVTELRSLRPDVVHSHFTRFDFPVLVGAHAARVFWHVHSHRENFSAAARLKAFAKYRILGRTVEALVAVSAAVKDDCIALRAPPERVRVVYNGIDVDWFRPPSSAERAEARARFGIDSADRVILFFERVPYKGGAVLREALRELPDFRLLVVGGKKADRERFGSAPRVIAMERVADTRRLYWAADALAFVSSGEAFGFVLAEALASELPVAASDIPVVREICGGVGNVHIFPVGDARALAEALIKAASDARTQEGRNRMIERFSVQRWTAEIMDLYGMA